MNRHETIVILDFGSQYTQLIARRFRELGVKTIIVRGDLAAERIDEYDSIGLVLSGLTWLCHRLLRQRA